MKSKFCPRTINQPWYPEMSKFSTKRSSLSSNSKHNPRRLWATLLLAPFKVKWAKKALSAKPSGGVFFRLQVQPRLLHRSFSAGQSVHNCIFNIKYCSNWTRGKRTRTAKRRLNFVHGGLNILRNAMLLWSCSRKVVRFPMTLSTTRILLLSLRELYFSFKMMYFFLKHMLSTEAKSELKDVEILEANWKTLTWLTYDRLADLACCEKYLKDNKNNSLHLTVKICSDICPWTLSVPRSSQFSSSFALGKLFASRNR